MRYICLFFLFAILSSCKTDNNALPPDGNYIAEKGSPDRLAIVSAGKAAPIWISPEEYEGVNRALKDLQSDIEKVTGILPEMVERGPGRDQDPENDGEIILAGTIGMNPMIDRLVQENKLDVSQIAGKWESRK